MNVVQADLHDSCRVPAEPYEPFRDAIQEDFCQPCPYAGYDLFVKPVENSGPFAIDEIRIDVDSPPLGRVYPGKHEQRKGQRREAEKL